MQTGHIRLQGVQAFGPMKELLLKPQLGSQAGTIQHHTVLITFTEGGLKQGHNEEHGWTSMAAKAKRPAR